MSFQSLGFLALVAVCVPACLVCGRRECPGAGIWLLAAFSAAFYLGGSAHVWGGFAVLAVSAGATYAALGLLRREFPARRTVFFLAVGWHVGVLLVFKCWGFFTGGTGLGWAPLGLSFFTFQQIWLLQRVYTGEFSFPAGGRPPLGAFALFTLFFPTVSSGPILRPDDFFPQLCEPRFLRPEGSDLAAGLYAISCGMAKKVLLADPLGIVVGNGWAADALSAPEAWLIMLAYTLQLYLDFSGYCDIAAGLARLFGLRLPVNFDSPYRALSVEEFWRRWHMTLTGFLRQCVYFPLGGSRRGTARTYANILLVFLVSGFWHGTGWTFLLWGALHGLAQIAERALGKRRDALPPALRWGITFLFVNGAWVFFRAPDLESALRVLSAAVAGPLALPGAGLLAGFLATEQTAVFALGGPLAAWFPYLALAFVLTAGLLCALLPGNTIRRMDAFRPKGWRAVVLALVLSWCVLSFTGVTSFIYSNF